MHVYNPAHLFGGKLRLNHSSNIGVELRHLFVYLISVFEGKIPEDAESHYSLKRFLLANCKHITVAQDETHLKVRAGCVVIAWLEKGLNLGRLGNWSIAQLPEKANFRGDGGRFTSDTTHLYRNLWQLINAANRAAQVVAASHDFKWDIQEKNPILNREFENISANVRELVNTAFKNHRYLPIESHRLANRLSQFLCKFGQYEPAMHLDKFYDAFARKEVCQDSVVGIPWTVARSCR